MIVYNYDADLEVSDTCVRSSLLSWVELSWVPYRQRRSLLYRQTERPTMRVKCGIKAFKHFTTLLSFIKITFRFCWPLFLRWQIKITVTCTKCYFPHPHYAVYHCAGHARCAVNCGIPAVTWSDLWTNHRRSAVSIPHFTHSHLQSTSMPYWAIQNDILPNTYHKPYTLTGIFNCNFTNFIVYTSFVSFNTFSCIHFLSVQWAHVFLSTKY